jgi:hypothetical protein
MRRKNVLPRSLVAPRVRANGTPGSHAGAEPAATHSHSWPADHIARVPAWAAANQAHFNSLKTAVRDRLREVCRAMPDDAFERLATRVAVIEMKFERWGSQRAEPEFESTGDDTAG